METSIGPRVLISGASTGIGEASARYMAARGWGVYAGVRNEEDAQRLASENITPLFLDVTREKEIAEVVRQIRDEAGSSGLQGLVNNAGIAVAGPMEFLPMEDLRRQFDVNFFGQVALTQACLPLLRIGRGRVVNVSSVGGRVAGPFVGPYSASKFALEAFTDALRRELLPWRMHVASIQPGSIKTPIWEKSLNRADGLLERLPSQARALYGVAMARAYRRALGSGERGISADIVARAIFHAFTSRWPRTRYIMGRGTRLTIWLARWLPDEAMDWLTARALYR